MNFKMNVDFEFWLPTVHNLFELQIDIFIAE